MNTPSALSVPIAPGRSVRDATAPVFCFYEDRATHEVGLRLALTSLLTHSPGSRVVVFAPKATADFRAWLGRFPTVRLESRSPDGAQGWNCKPHILLDLLASGADHVVWLDSDLILQRDCRPFFETLDDTVLVVAQEPQHLPHQGTRDRAVAWGLAPGREWGCTINSCVMRATPRHRELLQAWCALLQSPEYVSAQGQPFLDRSGHLASDQDALGALLGSSPHATLSVRVLTAGAEIIHSGGLLMYPLGARLKRLGQSAPLPLFIHAISSKPWEVLGEPGRKHGWDWWLLRLGQEVSPYVAHARAWRPTLEQPCPWLDCRTFCGRILIAAGLGNDALRGLPLIAAATLVKGLGFRRRL